MRDEKTVSYTVRWNQQYVEWVKPQEEIDEAMLACGEFEEAREVLQKIMYNYEG